MNFNSLFKSSLLLVLGAACVDVEGPVLERLGEGDILSELRIRSSGIMIEKGDSHQIMFDLIAVNNDTIPIDPTLVKWTTAESQILPVSSSGMIRGLAVSAVPINVIVEYEHKYVTRYDTVSVYVTDGRLDVNSIKLVALDSTRIGAFAFPLPRVRVDLFKDGSLVKKGALIPVQIDKPAKITPDPTGGPDREPVYRMDNSANLIGRFWIRSSLNLYGNEVSDSLKLTGLYGSLILPFVNINNIPLQVPVLDTVPLNRYQVCAPYMILNLTYTDTVDVLFSDSTASSSGCDLGPPSPWAGAGFTDFGGFVGGNVLRIPPRHAASRKSRTVGIISYKVRKHGTQEIIPWLTHHIQQIDVQD